jgi:hypothetical protein
MAIPAQNLTYIGQPTSPAQGQVITGNESGPLTKVVAGTATFTLDGTLTVATLNFVDGVQLLGQAQYNLSLTTVAAAVGGNTTYSGGGFSQPVGVSFGKIQVGSSVTFQGFSNGANNGTFTVVSVTGQSVTVNNASGVVEFNPAGAVLITIGGAVIAVDISRSGINDTAASGIGVVGAHAITNKGCQVDLSAAGSNGATMGIIAVLYFQIP